MKYIIIITLAVLTSCQVPAPCPDCNCPDTDTTAAYIYKKAAIRYLDSIYKAKKYEIDSMRVMAVNEVLQFRERAIEDIAAEEYRINGELAYLDSLKNAKYKDNLFIEHKPGTEAQVYFDSLTGKPVLKLY